MQCKSFNVDKRILLSAGIMSAPSASERPPPCSLNWHQRGWRDCREACHACRADVPYSPMWWHHGGFVFFHILSEINTALTYSQALAIFLSKVAAAHPSREWSSIVPRLVYTDHDLALMNGLCEAFNRMRWVLTGADVGHIYQRVNQPFAR